MKSLCVLCAVIALTGFVPLGYGYEQYGGAPPGYPAGSLAAQLQEFAPDYPATVEVHEDGSLTLTFEYDGQPVEAEVTQWWVSEDADDIWLNVVLTIGTNGTDAYTVAASGSDVDDQGILPVTYTLLSEPPTVEILQVNMLTGEVLGLRGAPLAGIIFAILVGIVGAMIVVSLWTMFWGLLKPGIRRDPAVQVWLLDPYPDGR